MRIGEREEIDEDLHLCVETYQWWLKKFVEHDVIIHRSADLDGACLFYLTGWSDGGLTWDGGHVNTDPEIVKEHITENAKLLEKGARNVVPFECQDTEIMVLAGGATLNDFEDQIIEWRTKGRPYSPEIDGAAGISEEEYEPTPMLMITVNGSYNWALERNLAPSLQLVIDARDFNQRFTKLVPGLTDNTKFVCASQCHPSVFDGLPLDEDRVFIWQVSASEELLETVEKHYGTRYKDWYPCPGGSTVMLRGLPLLRMLGYHKMHVFGFDSCVFDGKYHHAYPQEENDGIGLLEIIVAGKTPLTKTFKCFYWQVYQAREFQDMARRLLQDVDMIIYGDGMIAYMLETAVQLSEGGVEKVKLESKEVPGPICYAPTDRRGNVIT
jgi:hypothetical protein